MALFEALQRVTDVADLGPEPSRAGRLALKAAFTRRRDGAWVTTWKRSALWERLGTRLVDRAAARSGCRAVVEVQDLAQLDRPYFVWQDLSIAALLAEADRLGGLPAGFETFSLERLRVLDGRQRGIYANAAGLLPMSRWLAGRLRDSGVAAERIHVLHPGANVVPRTAAERPARRLLFVGRHFQRKGGDAVVAAFAVLRSRRPDVELTVIGPAEWPLDGAPPAGVRFLGAQPGAVVARELVEHDAFVMPSRFEAFGIALAEASCAGLPALARNAYAMPEIVTDGVSGVLVNDLGAEEVADGMERLLDDELQALCRAGAGAARERWSWDRAARELLAVVGY